MGLLWKEGCAGGGLTRLGERIKKALDVTFALAAALFVTGVFANPGIAFVGILLGAVIAVPWAYLELGKSNWED